MKSSNSSERELVPVDLGVDQLGDDVVAWVAAASLTQGAREHVQLGSGRLGIGLVRRILVVLGVVSAHHPVRPVEEQVTLVLGHPHDRGDGLQRELRGQFGDELALAPFDDLVHDELGPVDEVRLDQADHPRREPLVDEQPVAGVPRRVRHHHDPAAHVHPGIEGRGLQEGDAPLLGAESLGVAVHRLQIRVLGDGPEARSVGLRCPVDRVLGAEHREHLVVLLTLEPVQVQQVDLVQPHRHPRSARRTLPARAVRMGPAPRRPPPAPGFSVARTVRSGGARRPSTP